MPEQERHIIPWRKSSYSGANGDCLEAGGTANIIAARDSKQPQAPHLAFRHDAWSAFVRAINH
jgi:hypothetical protein